MPMCENGESDTATKWLAKATITDILMAGNYGYCGVRPDTLVAGGAGAYA
ncbi:hypothetical protein [Lacticaseibacillus hulanensis]|nr:hypothetical protein [Lacticaseibacillus hulanensis]